MQPHAAERRDLERQITLARPIFLVMALLDLLVISPAPLGRGAVFFVAVYLVLAVVLVWMEMTNRLIGWEAPLTADLVALLVFLVLTPVVESFWYLFLFVIFAAGVRWGMERAVLLAGLATFALLVRTAVHGPIRWPEVISWVALSGGTFAAGAGFGFLGARQRRHAAEHEFLAQLSGVLRVDQGLAESIRRVLLELTRAFKCEQAVIAFRDREIDRLFVWKIHAGETGRITPENLPVPKSDAFLLDVPDASVCWNSLEGRGDGFGWDRHDRKRPAELARLPGPSIQSLGLRSVLTTALEFEGRPDARVLLCNGKSKFSEQNLRWLERIARHLGPPLGNLYLLRHIRARAIETERNRISHDLHDGILQTLLSFDIQLEVLRRKLPQSVDQAAGELSTLQQTLRGESQELRRMVSDLRPLRVASADLVDLMRGFAERLQSESGLALDLLTDGIGADVPDRVCRELFQIYREALQNVKKHARASHVVVKLFQDEAKVSLVVDDNGQGFSFAGRFTSDELDRLRLGPISIKERTRSVGGLLTVESNPGHGARLTVEVPFN